MSKKDSQDPKRGQQLQKQTQKQKKNSQRSTALVLKPLLALLAVIVLSLVLLIYVAYVDAHKSYRVFLLDRIHSNGEIIKSTIEPLLQAGLPLNQLVGFNVITQPILDSDQAIAEVSIINQEEELLFLNRQSGVTIEEESTAIGALLVESDISYKVYLLDDLYRIRLPLSNRFEQLGELQLTMRSEVINQSILPYMRIVIIVAIAVIFLYALVLLILLRGNQRGNLSFNIVYNVAFLLVAVVLIISLIQIYSDGLQARTRALANSLAGRLDSALELGLDISDFDGIDTIFIDYKSLNPDLQYVSLNRQGTIISHTDPENIGREYTIPNGVIEYKRQLGEDVSTAIEIAVAIPSRIIYQRLLRNIKNFAVLFIATAFLAWLFLRILLSVNTSLHSVVHGATPESQTMNSRAVLDLIFPTFFLANFIEGLHYSYLPQYLRQLALSSGYAVGSVAVVYSIFWACYALVLIPAGRFARKIEGIRTLLVLGFSLIATSMLMVATVDHFAWMYLARALAGLGQGIVFIAVQSYILQSAKAEQITQGVTIIVYGYNGGVISGTVIGALLVGSLGISTLFFFSAVVAALLLWYAVQVVGSNRVRSIFADLESKSGKLVSQNVRETIYTFGSSGLAMVGKKFWKNVVLLFKDIEFTKSILCVGLIAKAVLTGVVFLVLPQLLSALQYRQEDIGQILMFYAAGVLLVSRAVARYTDRIGNTRLVLFLGALVSGVGLCIIASSNILSANFALQTIAIIVGIFILGLSHGFIHAPIVTHISLAPVSNKLGRSVVASIYRFLERTGHVLGPLLLGQALLVSQANISSIAYVGFLAMGFALIFIILPSKKEFTTNR